GGWLMPGFLNKAKRSVVLSRILRRFEASCRDGTGGRTGEITVEGLYRCDAQWSGLYDRMFPHTSEEIERRLALAADTARLCRTKRLLTPALAPLSQTHPHPAFGHLLPSRCGEEHRRGNRSLRSLRSFAAIESVFIRVHPWSNRNRRRAGEQTCIFTSLPEQSQTHGAPASFCNFHFY